MPGFGREPFGKHPFGHSNFGLDTTVRVFPQTSLEKDKDNKLHRYLATVSNSSNARRSEIDQMNDLVDPDKVRIDILGELAKMIGLRLDENEPEEFQRTLTRDAVQYFQLKGTDKGYSIRGLISGFDVEVLKIWSIAPAYASFIDPAHLYEFPPGSGLVSGIWYTDTPPNEVPEVSGVIPMNGNCDYCLTSFVKLNYTLKKIPNPTVFGNLLDRVILKVREVMPIHVRDVFIDLTIVIVTDPLDAGACVFIDENAIHLASYVDRYDIIAADDIFTDRHIPSVVNY